MIVNPGNAIHIGQRAEQQDSFALSDFEDDDFIAHGGYLAVVCDGIGGLRFGAEAAAVATDAFISSYMAKLPEQSIDAAMDIALQYANLSVLETARQHDSVENMGTTLIAVVIQKHQLHWRSIGDSHIYLFRQGRLSQLNPDHNVARMLQAQVDMGQITQQQADEAPQRAALCSFVGMAELTEVGASRQPLSLLHDDRVLLCTDGIYAILNDQEISHCLSANEPMQAAEALCEAALQKQSPTQDNLTAVVLSCADLSMGERIRRTWYNLVN